MNPLDEEDRCKETILDVFVHDGYVTLLPVAQDSCVAVTLSRSEFSRLLHSYGDDRVEWNCCGREVA